MSTQLTDLDKFISTITPAQATAALHQSQQDLRRFDIEFAAQMREVLLKVHPEAIERPFAALVQLRCSLLNALAKLEARAQDAITLADERFIRTTEQPSERPTHGAAAGIGPDNEGQ